MSEPFLGMIAIYGFNFAPRGWAMCNGQTTFALPNLQSRWPLHFGQGPGLSSYDLGQAAGTETVTLTVQQIPMHQHTVNATDADATSSKPDSTALLASGGSYSSAAANTTMSPNMIPPSGGGNQPHSIIQPYLALNFCIALEGIFPSRN